MSQQFENETDFYVVGGTLKPDAPSYIERKTDRELYEHILKGDFCCVLTPRQMGKSSLMIRTAQRLKKQGLRTAIIDLTRIGTGKEKTSADQWYYGIAYRILRELGLDTKLSEWWQEREKLPALQRLTEFFEDVLLPGTHEPVVIFVDEIDTTIALPFTDDFFAAVRACYNARAANPAYQRLNFVLLGVAAPSDLIKDAQRTPFNIGHGIRLTDFTPAEANPLSLGLCADPAQGEKMLARILYWTGGHPYLTQKLCRIAAEEKLAVHSDEAIDNLVEKNFLAPGADRQEPNLRFVSDRLLQDRKNSRQRLILYRRVYREKPVFDDPLSPTHTSLKLSGLVLSRTKQMLGIRNRIYERVFTGEWIKEVIPIDWNRYMMVAAATVLLIGIVIVYMFILPKMYIETIRSAQADVPSGPYDKLKGTPFYKTIAEELFADYWDRQALRSLMEENWHEGLLYCLKALTVKESQYRRREVAEVISDNYANLMATYRHDREVTSVAFSPSGKTVVIGSRDGTVQWWEITTGKHLPPSMKHGEYVTSVVFSPDGKTVLTGSDDKTAQLWDAVSRKPIAPPMKHGESVYTVAFSPDGKTVLTGSGSVTVKIWGASTSKLLPPPIKSGSHVSSIAFCKDGKNLFIGFSIHTGQLWDATTGKPLTTPMHYGSSVNSVVFSPDGKTLLTGSFDGKAQLWDVTTGKLLPPLIKIDGTITAVAFSPDGKNVLTGGLDGMARLLSSATGKPLAPPMKHGDAVWSVVFSADGKTITVATRFWIHQSTITGNAIKPKASRLLPGRWTGAYRFLDAKGDHMRVAVLVTSDSIKIIDLHFDKPDAPPIQGDPAELLKEWQEKLALKLNEETGKIDPMYPLPAEKEIPPSPRAKIPE